MQIWFGACAGRDHMVLQREMPIPVWGWADSAEQVTVTLGDQSKTATADSAGKWCVKFDSIKAGGPLELKVQGKTNSVQFIDVLVGEVWLCSGQSNMAMSVGGVTNKDAEIRSHPRRMRKAALQSMSCWPSTPWELRSRTKVRPWRPSR
jgi:sialate O-acetylesterase